jgi:hypothetical protein
VIGGRVLDPTAVLDFATGRSIYGRALVDVAVRTGIILAVPTAALMEAWAGATPDSRPLLAMLRGLPVVVIEPLDGESAEGVGQLAAERGRPASGVAHAVYVARRRGWSVVTGDPDAVLGLDPHIGFESLP